MAKFTFYKDKELVRAAASQYLTGNSFRVKEPYPAEIEERRKLLYGEAHLARQNGNNRVKLVRDKLCINGRQYIPGLPNRGAMPRQRNTNTTNTHQSTVRQTTNRVYFERKIDDTQNGRYDTTNGQYQIQQSTPQQQNQQRGILTAERRTFPHGQRSNVMAANSQPGDSESSFGANISTSNKYGRLGPKTNAIYGRTMNSPENQRETASPVWQARPNRLLH